MLEAVENPFEDVAMKIKFKVKTQSRNFQARAVLQGHIIKTPENLEDGEFSDEEVSALKSHDFAQ